MSLLSIHLEALWTWCWQITISTTLKWRGEDYKSDWILISCIYLYVQIHLLFQYHWIVWCKWIVYTDYLKDRFCKVCVLFGSGYGGCIQQQLGLFIKNQSQIESMPKKPLEKYEKAEYRRYSVEQAEGFSSVISVKKFNVIQRINI